MRRDPTEELIAALDRYAHDNPPFQDLVGLLERRFYTGAYSPQQAQAAIIVAERRAYQRHQVENLIREIEVHGDQSRNADRHTGDN